MQTPHPTQGYYPYADFFLLGHINSLPSHHRLSSIQRVGASLLANARPPM